jgi:hypothetical protein
VPREPDKLDRYFDRLQRKLPGPFRRLVAWLRKPGGIWVRIPLGLVFLAGGFLGFLPILGFWMVPLGLFLLAEDVRFLRTPVLHLMEWLERLWNRLKRWKEARAR